MGAEAQSQNQPTRREKPLRFSNAEAEEKWSRHLTTRSGFTFFVTPATPGDRSALENFFAHVTPEDLYYRFLTGLRKVDAERIDAMVCDSDPYSIDFIARDDTSGAILATAMLTTDEDFDTAEFALCTRAEAKHRGLSWTLLEHVAAYAEAMGVRRIRSIESWDDHAAVSLQREMGFTIRRDPEDSTLLIAEKVFDQV